MEYLVLVVLFVVSANSSSHSVSPFIKSQAESLRRKGIDVSFFLITQKGMLGYLLLSRKLSKYLRNHKIDLIHSHYVLCGWTCVLTLTRIPIVLSLMGDDAYGTYIGPDKVLLKSRILSVLTLAIQPFTSAIISKSENINKFVFRKRHLFTIPNGVQLDDFKVIDLKNQKLLSLDRSNRIVLFLGNPADPRKNIQLLIDAIDILNDKTISLVNPFPAPHHILPYYYNIASVFTSCAFMEGSPNTIKEAMACNCPIVATNVGDISWIFGDTSGCFISSFDPKDFAQNLNMALTFAKLNNRTNGRQRIIKLRLDIDSVADRILEVYSSVLNSGNQRKNKNVRNLRHY